MKINFVLNNKPVCIEAEPLARLIDILRNELSLTSVKEGCGEGECGACSILIDGNLVNSCLVPVGTIGDAMVVTAEGLRETDEGKMIIKSFTDEGSVQCGFCTPGMLIAAQWLLSNNPDPTEKEIREALSGNLCRCTGYDLIISGVKAAAENGAGLW